MADAAARVLALDVIQHHWRVSSASQLKIIIDITQLLRVWRSQLITVQHMVMKSKVSAAD